LTHEQIDKCYAIIAKKYPLRDQPITFVWPWLRYLTCQHGKEKKRLAEKQIELEGKLGRSLTKWEKKMVNNPLYKLGYGVVSYYKFIEHIWLLCLILLVLNLPIFWMFKDYNIYPDKPLAALSLGNFGGATTICEQIPHHMGSKSLRL
jgi:hypothetical protein